MKQLIWLLLGVFFSAYSMEELKEIHGQNEQKQLTIASIKKLSTDEIINKSNLIVAKDSLVFEAIEDYRQTLQKEEIFKSTVRRRVGIQNSNVIININSNDVEEQDENIQNKTIPLTEFIMLAVEHKLNEKQNEIHQLDNAHEKTKKKLKCSGCINLVAITLTCLSNAFTFLSAAGTVIAATVPCKN